MDALKFLDVIDGSQFLIVNTLDFFEKPENNINLDFKDYRFIKLDD